MEKEIHDQGTTLSPPVVINHSRNSNDAESIRTGMASYLEPEFQNVNLTTGETDRETEGWTTLLRYSKEFDDKMLREWQDELANLLTFTGLFSAVVTGFIAITINQLQEDSGDRSAALLAQISQQLSSFTTTNGIANSTFQPPPPTPFEADEEVVSINVLWMTSLTLSLMAAFWTIAVQQWLRQFPLPRETTVRESVRLRQLRYDGLMSWRVPAIVSLLPLCMQVSVLLFLVGLLLYLRSLNRVVGDSFAIVGGTLFSLFLVTIPLPLIFPICPYKSPLLPTCGFFLQALVLPIAYPSVVFLRWFITRVLSAIIHITYKFLGLQHIVRDGYWTRNTRDVFQSRLIRFGSWFYRHIWKEVAIVHPVIFWTLRELRAIREKRRFASADTAAVASAPIAIPEAERSKVLACLEALADDKRREAASLWACLDLGLLQTDLVSPVPIDLSGLYNGCLETLDHGTLVRLRPVLLQVLPDSFAGYQWAQAKLRTSTLDPLYTSVMTLLYWSTRWAKETDVERDSVFFTRFLGALVGACESQEAQFAHMIDRAIPYVWLPITVLFNLLKQRCMFDRTQTIKAVKRACTLLRAVNEKIEERHSGDFKEVLVGVLGATATALIPITKGHASPSDVDVRTELDSLLVLLKTFVQSSAYRHAINHLHLLRPLDTAKMLTVDAAAIKSIARHFYRLAEKGHIARSEECPSRHIVARMIETCELHQRIYVDALPRLRAFAERWPAPSLPTLSQAVALSASVLARAAVPSAHDAPQRDSAFSEKAGEAV